MTDVSLHRITKSYDGADRPSLQDVDLHVHDGELFVLVGPSGCGKSTLLKLLAGLEHPTAGELYMGDRLMNWVGPTERNVALVFQSYALYPNMTVRQNVRFPLKMQKVRRAEADRAVAEALASLGLGDLATRRIDQLSGGERQRVALARALVRKPAVTLMDEPLSNLDAQLRHQTRDELLRLHREVPGTLVYVTHDQVEAMTMADRMAVLSAGRVVQVGTPAELYVNPATVFVARFLGSPPMNTVAVRGAVHGDDVALVGDGVHVVVPARMRQAVRRAVDAGPELTLGVRPEALRLAAPTGEGDAWTVELVEYLGMDFVVALRRGDAVLRARVALGQRPAVGDRCALAIDDDALYAFDGRGDNVLALGAEAPAVVRA